MATGTSDIPISASLPAEPPTPRVARAAVDVGSTTTHYLRAGCGAPILLLSAGAAGDPGRNRLLAALAPRFRTIAPELGGDDDAQPSAASGRTRGAAFSAWLRGFLDGLGILQVSIVAEEPFGVPSLGFSLTDPDRVDRIVLLYRDTADPDLQGGVPQDRLRQSDHPLFLLRMGDGAENSADSLEPGLAAEMVRFLSGEPATGESEALPIT